MPSYLNSIKITVKRASSTNSSTITAVKAKPSSYKFKEKENTAYIPVVLDVKEKRGTVKEIYIEIKCKNGNNIATLTKNTDDNKFHGQFYFLNREDDYGTYKISKVTVIYTDGDCDIYHSSDKAFPDALKKFSLKIGGKTPKKPERTDTSFPVLKDIYFAKDKVNMTKGQDGTVDVVVVFSDKGTGLWETWVVLQNKKTGARISGDAWFAHDPAKTRGKAICQVKIGKYTDTSDWEVVSVNLLDYACNCSVYSDENYDSAIAFGGVYDMYYKYFKRTSAMKAMKLSVKNTYKK